MMKKMMKSMASVLLAFMMVFSACAVGMVGFEAEAATYQTEGFFDFYVEDGEATVAYYDQFEAEAPVDVVIPDTLGGYPVTAIDVGAFEASFFGYSVIESVVIPASVKSIGYGAFSDCAKLKTVVLAEGSQLETIDQMAFDGATSLSSLSTIPASVTTIGMRAFGSCEALEKIAVDPANAIYTNDANGVLFNKDKTQLVAYPGGNTNTSYAIPASVTEILPNAFHGTAFVADVTFEAGTKIKTIGTDAFGWSTSLASIVIPDSVVTIKGAFTYCPNLKTVTYGENSNVETISGGAFSSCDALEVVYIPAKAKDVSFPSTGAFKKVIVDPANPYYWADEHGAFFNKEKTKLICFPVDCETTNYTVPEGVKEIDKGAFSRCYALTNVTFPSTLEKIGTQAFYMCKNLKAVTIPANVSLIGDYAFDDCISLETVTFEENSKLKEIGDDLFDDCESLATIRIPKGVTKICSSAFVGCESLNNIWIPKSVTALGVAVFTSCYSLTDVYYEGNSTEFAKIEKVNQLSKMTIHYEGGEVVVDPVDPVDPVVPETKISIKTPSTRSIDYGETLILHTETANLPEGSSIFWFVNGKGVSVNFDDEGKTCKVKATGDGTATVTAKVVTKSGDILTDADGKEISASIKISSDGSFWQMIISFIKDLFRIDRVIDK